VDREKEEEVKKKMISLWKKQGRARGYIDKTRNRSGAFAPTHYSITASTCHSIAHRAPFQAQNHVSPFNYGGRRWGGPMMSGPLVNGNSQTAVPFQFPFIVLLHGPGTIFNLQPLSPPSTSILVTTSSLFNFNPPCQLHPSSPLTSTLIAFQFLNPIVVLFPPLLLDDARGVLDVATARRTSH
jgi:hypothetical protein